MNFWKASAPSNIALIKYMGKVDAQSNIPSNKSLSLTLSKLLSFVEIEKTSSNVGFSEVDSWETLHQEGVLPIQLSAKGQQRFLKNWQRLKEYFDIEGTYVLRSANNFPADCGIASSASSFAALTLAAFEVAKAQGKKNCDLSLSQLADLSRQSSGSSCRSFFSPWAEWAEDVHELSSIYDPVFHYVVIVDDKVKNVSSSEAHLRVPTSMLFSGRTERAEQRLKEIKKLLTEVKSSAWYDLFELCWQEFWDMQSLFETARPSFGYLSPKSLQVLNIGKELWQKIGDGPLLTMDAGPNVHFLWRKEQKEMARQLKIQIEKLGFQVVVGNE
ncbi:MAG: diphosphomevalonate decarboxylase [Bdellovibrionaceae bacterium]|nr:diphosphomevalonate decarboxylase [Pseudobdellovibrionaceae bacterium]